MAYPGAPEGLAELLHAYEHGLEQVEAAVRGMTAEQMRSRPVAGRWSTIEVLCHLCDSDLVISDRIKRTIAMERPLLLSYDENKFVAALGYQERDAGEELAAMRMTRGQLLRVLKAMPAAEWDRQAVHSERGLVTVKQLVQTAVGHLLHHLPFVEEKRRAMGVGK